MWICECVQPTKEIEQVMYGFSVLVTRPLYTQYDVIIWEASDNLQSM